MKAKLKVVRELDRLDKLTMERVAYLKVIKEDKQDRAIIQMINRNNESIKEVNAIVGNLQGKELRMEVRLLENRYMAINEVTEHLKEFIRDLA